MEFFIKRSDKRSVGILVVISLLTLKSLEASAEYRRSYKAKAAFKYSHPCPSTGRYKGSCQGYVIDHVIPLACGGADEPKNMQWQTKAEARAKDKWERKGC